MENFQNTQLKAALELFISQDTKSFTFGAPENNSKNNINLSQSDVDNLFNVLIANKEKLYNLYLYGTGITEIPKSIGQLSNLTILNLIDNKIEQLPDELCALKKIQILSLSNNKITNLPESIGVMKTLKWIDLRDNKRIENLPDSIINLSKLEKLNLMNTGIKKDDTNKIEQLEQLCINNNDKSYGTKMNGEPYTKDIEFYKNPKILIDDIGLKRKQNENVLSKYDFDFIIRRKPYPESPTSPKTKATKRKTPTGTHRSPSPSSRRTKKSKTPSPPRKSPSPKSTTKKSPTP